MKNDILTISYSKLNESSCLLIARKTDDNTIIINEYMNEEADKLYCILCGYKNALEDLEDVRN